MYAGIDLLVAMHTSTSGFRVVEIYKCIVVFTAN